MTERYHRRKTRAVCTEPGHLLLRSPAALSTYTAATLTLMDDVRATFPRAAIKGQHDHPEVDELYLAGFWHSDHPCDAQMCCNGFGRRSWVFCQARIALTTIEVGAARWTS